MAIPQGRLSTEPVPGTLQPPENRTFYALTSYELGPVAIEDTSEGLMYQNWSLTWDSNTFELIATPETVGSPVSVTTVEAVKHISFTFDQNGRISICWVTNISTFLYWYDTAVGQTVVTDLGVDVITPCITLDDKRATQNTANDMLLWYTRPDGLGTYSLYQKIQRERFLTEHLEVSGLAYPYLHNVGMHNALRIQFILKNNPPNLPYPP